MSLFVGDDTPPTRTQTSDIHVRSISPLPNPCTIIKEMPLGDDRAQLVSRSRDEVRAVLNGDDDRLVVVVGPCSVHDTEAALDYASRLAVEAEKHRDDLLVVMRMYFEKPRTTVGWKGLINDPGMDETYDIPRGLRLARSVLLGVLDAGLPVGCEFLEPTSPQYIADTVTWGAIGARTTESQVHRQLASGLSMPIGFKNATDGNVQVAIDGCRAARSAQVFFGSDPDGHAALVSTTGNPDTHVILRGGRKGPNYAADNIADAVKLLAKAGLPQSLMVDASHANSGKSHIRQAEVATEVAAMVADGNAGISGVMLESFLVAGRQEPGPGELVYGQSVTDACMDFATTATVLDTLASAVRSRRQRLA
ncbi:3-deoxy-7-phosphoheptulonate synthase [Hoyosella rhizosphaerae]|uniref:Phospho-2-dehydro-3-deoxyheptonate aldolase n=1 Tax=Hoyosella rhizosphaerae TaxID=1755582 RepID=A0A916UCL9_9ACTN|nr:3-deoxy-7-phosphoheptulonate synthase [Hoyosella rhizosphaerae]MBN4925673.1 3-deoxy-7-phosphoheptulonate synthase [Hoyosella rhizosphaerae]GGC68790.1 phospho-2-dehydro-3-deoxyheptonate aldolase [Hoyosella rhizosphaerae]